MSMKTHQGSVINSTERKQTEDAVRESDERFCDPFENAPLGYQSLDSEGRFIEVNAAWLKTLGYKREDVIGKGFDDFLAPDYVQAFRDRFPVFKAEGKIHSEFYMMHKDGSKRYIAFDGRIGYHTDGSFKQTHCILKDETDRKRAEDALADSEKRYRLLVENQTDLVVKVDVEGRFLFVSPTYCKMFGKNDNELLGQAFMPLVHEDDKGLTEEAMKTLYSPPHTAYIEQRAMTRNGWRWIAWMDTAVLDSEGKVTEIIGVGRDITERKQAEEALKQSEELLLETERIGNVGGWSFNIDTMAQTWTPEVYRIHEIEISPNPTVEAGINYYTKASRPIIEKAVQRAIELGEEFDLELEIITAKGNTRAVHTIGKADLNNRRIYGFFQDITERKRVEEELHKSKKELERTLEATTDGIWSWNFKTDTLFFSPKYYKMLGYEPNEFPANFEIWSNLIHPDDRERALACAEEYLKTKPDEYENEFRVRAKSNEYRLIHAYARVVEKDKNGEAVLLIGNHQDITERKRAEDQYKILFREMMDGFALHQIVCNAAGKPVDYRFLAVNPAFERMTGLTATDIVGRTVLDVLPGTEQHWINTYGRVALSGEPAFFESHAANLGKHFEVTAFRPAIGQFACIFFDITERKQAETYREMGREVLQILNEPGNLQDSIQRILTALKTRTGCDAVGLRLQEGDDFPYFVQDGFPPDFLQTENSLVERGKDGGVCRDKDGNVCLECTCGLVISGKTDPVNPLFTQGGSSWTNDSFTLLDLPSDQDPRRHPRNNCIHQGYASVALIPVRNRERIVGLIQLNDKRKGRFTIETIEILEGIAAHIGSALMRKRAEEEREKLQAQLNQAQKMESVGRLAGGVAHDFNNLLMGIMGYAELCREELPENHPVREWLDEITREAQRSANLTRQLLAFARKQTVAPKVLDLNDAVANMLKMLRRLIGEDIDLTWQPGAELWAVKIDPGQVDQILANLCVNARDAIGGAGKVTIETNNVSIDADYCADHVEAAVGSYVILAVSDDGCGMDRETLSNVFEPFFTTKPTGEGTGLGLATVYGIAKQNHGFVNVYSEPGKGSTFRIYLPRDTSVSNAATQAATKTGSLGGTETILLVEDETAIRTIMCLFLEKLGYTVIPAESPAEALRLAKAHRDGIDLMITDVVMPGMSGRDLAEKLAPDFPSMKILYMSGYTANVIAHRGILDEGVHFLGKPVGRDALAQKVREVLG